MKEKKNEVVQKKTHEELEKEIQELKSKLEKSKKLSLIDQVKFFQEKTKKIQVLDQFKEVNESLTQFINEVKEEKSKGVFNSDKFVVVFGNKGYNSRIDEIFRVSKSELLDRMAFFMIGEVDKKVKELEAEILAD